MKVIFSDGISHLAGRDKDAIYLYEMFHTRSRLHQIAYQHKINHSINTMICDAFTLANSHITITGTNDKLLSISEAISDPVAFTKLSDNIFYQIANSESKHKDMIKARSIIQRIFVRDLYKLCAKAKSIKPAGKLCTNTIAEEVIKNSQKNSLKKEDIFVVIVNINYGFKTSNPVDNFLFYSKNFPEKSYKIRSSEISSILPKHFQDTEIRLFCRNNSKVLEAKYAFDEWCQSKNLSLIQTNEVTCLTPVKEETDNKVIQLNKGSKTKVKLSF